MKRCLLILCLFFASCRMYTEKGDVVIEEVALDSIERITWIQDIERTLDSLEQTSRIQIVGYKCFLTQHPDQKFCVVILQADSVLYITNSRGGIVRHDPPCWERSRYSSKWWVTNKGVTE